MSYDTITRTFGSPAVDVRCGECDLVFAVPKAWYDAVAVRRENGGNFWCPNGHSRRFTGKSEAEKLRDELAREKHRAEQAQADAEQQRRRVAFRDRQLAARKGQVTKMRKRIERGVCPCCNRYFADLHRHMESKHHGWRPEDERVVAPPAPGGLSASERMAWQRGAIAGDSEACPYANRGRGVRLRHAWESGRAAAAKSQVEDGGAP